MMIRYSLNCCSLTALLSEAFSCGKCPFECHTRVWLPETLTNTYGMHYSYVYHLLLLSLDYNPSYIIIFAQHSKTIFSRLLILFVGIKLLSFSESNENRKKKDATSASRRFYTLAGSYTLCLFLYRIYIMVQN